jgi:hypothetical protein
MIVIKIKDLNKAKKALISIGADFSKVHEQAQKEGKKLDSEIKIKDDLKKGK